MVAAHPCTSLDASHGARLARGTGIRPTVSLRGTRHSLASTFGRRQVVAAAAPGSGDSSAEQLRLENERLREALANRLDAMAPDKARALVEQHRRLRASAGLGGPAPIAAQGTAAPQTVEQGTAPANGSSNRSEQGGSRPDAAQGPGSAGPPSNSGSSRWAAMADAKPSSGSQSSSSGGSPAGPQPSTSAPRQPAAAGQQGGASEQASARAGPGAAATKVSREAEIAAANKEVEGHDPKALSKGRESWLYFTVPEKPVAGANCVVYFNRAQSEPLRNSGRLQLHAKYNTWELAAPEGDRVDMQHDGRIGRAEGLDYYSARLTVPEEAFEINWVVSNGDGAFDNNFAQNYVMPVRGPVTRDIWIDSAAERAEVAWRQKKAEEEERAKTEAAAAAAAKLEDDQRRAEEAVAQLKNEYAAWQKGASKQEVGRWRMVPASARPGSMVKIQYNRLSGPLNWAVPEGESLVLRIGHNNWQAPQDVKMARSAASAAPRPVSAQPPAPAAGAAPAAAGAAAPAAAPAEEPKEEVKEEWWEALVSVPKDAATLNFVVFLQQQCDNNERRDFKALVDLPSGKTVESWADAMLAEIRASITAKREAQEAEQAEKERQRLALRRAAQAKAEAVRRKQMKHVLFTVPEVPQAGQDVTVYYNPQNGALPGRQRIFIKGGWNRWRHPKAYGPLEMTPPKVGDHFQVTLRAPKDAYYLDFVFTDALDGGQYDSNLGLDFHIPVAGSVVEEPPLHVVHVAVEMAPICKVGGLGDVVTSLGRAVQDQGHQVEVILPRYDFFQASPLLGGTSYETEFDYGGTKVFVTTCMVEGLRCFFIEPRNGMFSGAVYQGNNDAGRFDFFSRAALEFLLRSGRQPDILHCHDWSTADVAKAYWTEYQSYGLWKPNVVFTIHNMDFGATKLGEAAHHSQRFTTVSPSYAFEIGGHPAIAPNAGKLWGVRNGIDIDIWDPETDIFLPRGYTPDTVVEGKAAAREELRKRVNLNGWGDKPMVGVVSRLTKQKGTHLIAHSVFRTIDRGGQFVLLGSAPDPKIQGEFDALKNSYGGQDAAFCFAYDEPLSHLIYAACDIILVPSMFEPCGLTQLIAMRYGAIPVVRQTGGLKDTVFDVDNDKSRAAWELEGSTDWVADNVDATNGFSFEGTDDGALDYALNRALDAYYNDRAWFHSLQKRVMLQDWSWNKPAHDYIELYYAALKS